MDEKQNEIKHNIAYAEKHISNAGLGNYEERKIKLLASIANSLIAIAKMMDEKH